MTEPKRRRDLELRILDRSYQVPRADCWLRVFQHLGMTRSEVFFHSGFYCWNNRCLACVFRYVEASTGELVERQGCQVSPQQGDQVVELPRDMSIE